MPVPRAIRSTISLLTSLAFMLSGCSRSVTVPTRELAPASEWKGRYRITTTGASYTTKEFAVTDSTIVITKLSESDDRYGRADLPLTVPLREVKSVERIELNTGKTAIPVLLVFVVVVLYIAGSESDIGWTD